MKKMLFISAVIIHIIFCLQACSKDENNYIEPPVQPGKDSKIEFDGKTYSSWIKDASYGITIHDSETKKEIAEIYTEIEGGLNQTIDMGFGEYKHYTIAGCYILDIKKNEDNSVFLLIECSNYKYGAGITEIIKLQDNKITERVKYTNLTGRPNKLLNWYNGEIVAAANIRLSTWATYDFYIYGKDLNLIHNGLIEYETLLEYNPVGTFNIITLDRYYNREMYDVCLYNFKDDKILWTYEYKKEPAVIKKKEITVKGSIISFNIDLVYKDGSKDTKFFKLNINDGSLAD